MVRLSFSKHSAVVVATLVFSFIAHAQEDVQLSDADKKSKVEQEISQRLEMGEEMPPRVRDPGYEVGSCFLRPSQPTPTIVNVTGRSFVCEESEGGKAIIKWRAWYCEEDIRCVLSAWPNGDYPSYGEPMTYANTPYEVKEKIVIETADGVNIASIEVDGPMWVGSSQEKINQLVDAARKGDLDRVELLISQGVNINGHAIDRGLEKGAAIIQAAIKGETEVVVFLIENGATNLDESLTFTAENGHLDTVKALADRGGVPGDYFRWDWDKDQALLCRVVQLNHIDVAQFLLERFPTVRMTGADLRNCLLRIDKMWEPTTGLKFLLSLGVEEPWVKADLTAALRRVISGRPRPEAEEQIRTRLSEQLLSAGADPHTAYENGHLAIHHAAWIGNAELVQLLLNYGADINARDLKGSTPLAFASKGAEPFHYWHSGRGKRVYEGYIDVVKLLLSRGADPSIKDQRRRNPLKIAKITQKECKRGGLPRDCSGFATIIDLLKSAQ